MASSSPLLHLPAFGMSAFEWQYTAYIFVAAFVVSVY